MAAQDPIGEEGGINLYGFVGNSPLENFDRLGLQAIPFLVKDGNCIDRCLEKKNKYYNDSINNLLNADNQSRDEFGAAKTGCGKLINPAERAACFVLEGIYREAGDVTLSLAYTGNFSAININATIFELACRASCTCLTIPECCDGVAGIDAPDPMEFKKEYAELTEFLIDGLKLIR